MARRSHTKAAPAAASKALAAAPPGVGKLWTVLLPIAVLASFCLLDRIDSSPHLLEAFGGAVGALLVFLLLLYRRVARTGRTLSYEFVPRPVHYIQFLMHTSVYVYWGWYWREVYHDVSLIAAQIAFAYACDMLVCWSRRDKWVLGFGPVPIVMSTNLFLWFKDDWFYLQFLLIATGVLGKEFIKWKREGRLTHIFNPSAFSLCIFSIVLIATHSTDTTWGISIARTMHNPPNIYLEIFVLGLIVQALFRVTLVTFSAAAALYLLNLIYTHATGDYQFIDSNIPVAVFLGLHLLTTDPATSPRRDLGKIIFGFLYGAGVFAAYSGLKLIGAPEFYDKLLIVPPLNLTVKLLDHFSDAVAARFSSLAVLLRRRPRALNYAWMAVWAGLFVAMTASGFLVKGDAHPGSHPAFWAKRCQDGHSASCTLWVNITREKCQNNSTADCLELGQILNEGRWVKRDAAQAAVALGHAWDLGGNAASSSLLALMRADGSSALSAACDRGDVASCLLLGSAFSQGFGVEQNPSRAFELFQKSCELGSYRACGRLGDSYLVGQGTPVNPSLAIASFEKGCQGKNAASCLEAARFYHSDKWGFRVEALARQRLQQACDLGLQNACQPDASPPATAR